MTIICVTENSTKFYGVTLQKNGCVKVQKFEDLSDDKNIIYKVKPMETFLGKSQLCNQEVFDGKTILSKIGEENNKHSYVYIGGDMICTFLTNDRIYKYISYMGNHLCPYSVATVEENYYFSLQISNLLKRKRLIMILYWMEYTFQIQWNLLRNGNCTKFIRIMIRVFYQINMHYYLKL